MPVGQGDQVVGDMPHNWASAEFIRLVRHSLILERGNELHLFEAMPAKWARPGAVTRLRDIATEFGPVSLEFRVSQGRARGPPKSAPRHNAPRPPASSCTWTIGRAKPAHWTCPCEGAVEL